MACCGAENPTEGGRRHFPIELLRVAIEAVCSLALVLVVTAGSPFWREAREKRRPFAVALLRSLGGAIDELLDTPFLVDSRWRCRVSGRLYAHSEALAGIAYRFFNVAVFALTVGMLSALILLAAAVV